jgi:hypothetical protein
MRLLPIASALALAALPACGAAQTTKVDGVDVPAGIDPCYKQSLTSKKAAEMRRRLLRQGFMVTVTKPATGETRTDVPAVLPASLGRGRIAVSGC